jgi:hypothetical protein
MINLENVNLGDKFKQAFGKALNNVGETVTPRVKKPKTMSSHAYESSGGRFNGANNV